MPRRWHLYYAPNKLSSLPSRDRWQGYVYPCSIVVLLLHLVLEEKVVLIRIGYRECFMKTSSSEENGTFRRGDPSSKTRTIYVFFVGERFPTN